MGWIKLCAWYQPECVHTIRKTEHLLELAACEETDAANTSLLEGRRVWTGSPLDPNEASNEDQLVRNSSGNLSST